jgi:hypothetical protein
MRSHAADCLCTACVLLATRYAGKCNAAWPAHAAADLFAGFCWSLTVRCCMVQDNVVIITGDIHTHWAAEVVEQACKNQTGYSGYEETGADPPNSPPARCLPSETPQLPSGAL